MANLNLFRNVTANLTTVNTTLYTAPITSTSILLMAQITNITTSSANVTFVLNNTSTNTELAFNLSVPPNDAVNVLAGKLVLQNGHSVFASASANSTLKATLSVLETLN
jgi:hypothetical protein